jgi:hypothetical protein
MLSGIRKKTGVPALYIVLVARSGINKREHVAHVKGKELCTESVCQDR